MRLEDFPRPKNDNRRGVHWSASVYHPAGEALNFWISELQAMKIKWVKVLDDSGGSSLELCRRLLAADIMPIVRLYRLEPNPNHIGGREEDTVRRMVAAGVRYFETNNEPDLPLEWKGGRMPPNWLDIVIENFIHDADRVIALGGLPALPAMGVGSDLNPIIEVTRRGRADLFDKGAWVAIHNYTLNHPLDYPYDPVNQEGQPVSQEEYDRLAPWGWEGRPREQINEWRRSDKNPGDTLADDAACFLAFQLMDEMVREAVGHPVPIISTEGGPVVGWKEDRRYPRIDPHMHAQWVSEIAEFMQGTRLLHGMRCADSYFTMCHWLIANYRMSFLAPTWESNSWYTDWWNAESGLMGELPVVARLKALPDAPAGPVQRVVITGRVMRSDTDAGLPELAVGLLRDGHEVAVAMTGPDGAFTFANLAPGVYDIAVTPWGVVRRGVLAPEEPPPGGVQPILIRLSGGRSSVLTGVVQDAAGALRAAVPVRLTRSGLPVGQVTTGADGAFRFGELPLGSYQLSAPGVTVSGIALDGWQTKNVRLMGESVAPYRYAAIQQRLLPESETANRRIFYGTVTDATGTPLNGVKLQLSWQDAAPGTQFPTTTTGRDPFKPAGSYEFLHSPGMFSVQVVQGDWPSDVAEGLDTARVPGREGQPIAYEINFQLQAAGADVQVDGTVPGGAAGQQLTLSAADGTVRTTVLADEDFAFTGLPVGAYRLALEGIGPVVEEIVLEPGARFKLIFPLRSRLSGRVMSATDGLVAVLYAPPLWGWTRQAVLDPQGEFVIESLPPGNYRLEINGFVLTDLLLNGENELQLAAVDLGRGQRSVVRGRVADVAGRPQTDILMTLRRDAVLVAQTRTDAGGAYQFVNLPAGSYTLEAVGLGQVAAFLLDGAREEVADVLWPGVGSSGVLQGRVLDAESAPVGGAWVRLLLAANEVARVQTDAGGAFRFTGLASGVYALAQAEGAPLITGIEVAEDATVTQDLVLPAPPARLLGHYLLFAPPPAQSAPRYTEARLLFGLAARQAARSTDTVSLGYSVADAGHASRVTIVGDQITAETEAALEAAGCQVKRLSGDPYTLVDALAQLFAGG